MADNSCCTECEGEMKDTDIKCVQCSLCQEWVHLECFVMAAGLDEALFQGTKVDPTKKKKVKRSVNEGRVITQDQLDLIEAALSAQCVIVICKRCQSGGDVKKIITKLYNTASKSAVLTEALEGRMNSVEHELKDTKAQLELIQAAPPVMQDEELQKLKEEVEVTVRKSFADTVKKGGGPGIIPLSTQIRDQMKQQRLTDDRKGNIIIHNLPDTGEGGDKSGFMNIVEVCGVNIGEEDVMLVKRLGKPGANKLRPVLITLSSEDKKRKLFKNLGIWRSEVMKERDPNDETLLPSIDHDYTIEQRKEKNTMLTVAKNKQRNEPEGTPFRFRVRGPPDSMHVIKMDTRTRRWEVVEVHN